MDENALVYRNAQMPCFWLLTAERLRDAAEIILQDQVRMETPYFQEQNRASQEALAKASVSPERMATVQIQCDAPNYLPAQMLYAFAFENALKGLIIARSPELASGQGLAAEIKSHDLVRLSQRAEFEIFSQEQEVLEALSTLGEWAGRYPTAATFRKHGALKVHDPHILLDFGSKHPVMRRCLDRAIKALSSRVPPDKSPWPVIVAWIDLPENTAMSVHPKAKE